MNRISLGILLGCLLLGGIAVAGNPTLPSGITSYLPINVINSQASAMPYNAQIPIAFNALAYQSYESNTLNNTEFFYANGTVMASWLEGNTLNEQGLANALYKSANVLFWVRVQNSNVIFPASSSNFIYLGFASQTTNLFGNTITGEAPQLSCNNPANTMVGCTAGQYGEYDTGANVFAFYDNFSGFALNTNLWNSHVSNMKDAVDNGIFITWITTGASAFDLQAKSSYAYPLYTDTLYGTHAIESGSPYFQPVESTSTTFGGQGWDNSYGYGFEGTTSGMGYWGSTGTSSGLGSNGILAVPFVSSVVWSATGAEYGVLGYTYNTFAATSTSSAIGNYYPGFIEYGGAAAAQGILQWFRSRTYPPGNIQPTASFGSVGFPPSPTTGNIVITKNTIGSDGSFNFSLGGPQTNTIGGFNFPVGGSFDSNGLYAWWANYQGGSISEISTKTNTIIKTITNADNPADVAVTSNGLFAYITETQGAQVAYVNLVSGSVTNVIHVCPMGINMDALSPSGTSLYVTCNNGDNSGYGGLYTINTANGMVAQYMDIPNTWGVAVAPNGNYLYITMSTYPGSVIDVYNAISNTITNTIGGFASSTYGVSFAPNGAYAYVMEDGTGKVMVVNTSTNSIVGSYPGLRYAPGTSGFGLAISPLGGYAYVANYNNTLSVLNITTWLSPNTIIPFRITTSGNTGSYTINNVLAGNYASNETNPAPWVFEGATCSNGNGPNLIYLQPTNTVSCTFTDANRGATITITKNTIGGDGTFPFTMSNALSTNDFSITTSGGTGTYVLNNLYFGNYTINEIVPSGWQFVNSTCSGTTSANIDLTSPTQNAICAYEDFKPYIWFTANGLTSTQQVINMSTNAGSPDLWICGMAESFSAGGFVTNFPPDVSSVSTFSSNDGAIGRQSFNLCNATDYVPGPFAGVMLGTNTTYTYNILTVQATAASSVSLAFNTPSQKSFGVLVATCSNGASIVNTCDPGGITVPSGCVNQYIVTADYEETAAVYTCDFSTASMDVFSATSGTDMALAVYLFTVPNLVSCSIPSFSFAPANGIVYINNDIANDLSMASYGAANMVVNSTSFYTVNGIGLLWVEPTWEFSYTFTVAPNVIVRCVATPQPLPILLDPNIPKEGIPWNFIFAMASIILLSTGLIRKGGSPEQIGLYIGAIAFMWMAVGLSLTPIQPSILSVGSANIINTLGGRISGYSTTLNLNTNPQGEQTYIEGWFGWIYTAIGCIFLVAGVLGRLAPKESSINL